MSVTVSIVMYHYVRDLINSRYPNIKGLSLSQFKEQLAFLTKYYHFVTFDECKAALHGEVEIPANSAVLSFDDAYIDHYLNIFPILNEMGIQGWFFPSAKALLHKKVLDVNKIHFVLATSDIKQIIADINLFLDMKQTYYGLASKEYYFSKLAHPNRFDSHEVVFVKQLLQFELPLNVRQELVDILFRKYVTIDEAAFSNELYMSIDQLKCLVRNGMYVGSHGYDHFWLDTLTVAEQEFEVDMALRFLADLGIPTKEWIMCYPYGVYDKKLLELLRKKGCVFGLTTQVGIAELDVDKALTLPRLDTNDLPKDAVAAPNNWTRKILVGL